MIGEDKSRSVLVWLIMIALAVLFAKACRTIIRAEVEEQHRTIPVSTEELSGCESIRNIDRRNYCKAMQTRDPSWCAVIKSLDLRAECRAVLKDKHVTRKIAAKLWLMNNG